MEQKRLGKTYHRPFLFYSDQNFRKSSGQRDEAEGFTSLPRLSKGAMQTHQDQLPSPLRLRLWRWGCFAGKEKIPLGAFHKKFHDVFWREFSHGYIANWYQEKGGEFVKRLTHLFTIYINYYLVVWAHLKNISQIGSFPQVGAEIKIFETTT